MIHPHTNRLTTKAGQTWRKQKKLNTTVKIKLTNRRQNGKRRIVQHDGSVRVIKVFIIASREKRAHDFIWVNAVFFASPIFNDRVHAGRSVAIVCSLFGFKFIHKLFVCFAYCHFSPSSAYKTKRCPQWTPAGSIYFVCAPLGFGADGAVDPLSADETKTAL